jgi:DNA-binding MarR family transcriptional regulator/GNAT superfamily N-acetyltransferase
LDGVAQVEVEQVRSFNRLVTQSVGALQDNFLARDRPLGQARVLWGIGPGGCDVVRLRSLLGLDSGYLSRLLRSLEAGGLVVVEPQRGDRRVRVARLTPDGLRERELLDEAADGLARSLLEPLGKTRRERLVEAMAEVEHLLTASLVEIAPADPSHRDVQLCIGRYFAEIDERFESGFDMSLSVSTTLDDFRPPAGIFLLARLRGEPVGCGGLRFRGEDPPELKRMWVRGSERGLGIGRRLLAELEAVAAAAGARSVRLETNKALAEALNLYRSTGYRDVPPFNDEHHSHHWLEKALGPKM